MVLRNALVLGLLALAAGCIHRVPEAHLAEPTPCAMAYDVDTADKGDVMPMPDEVVTEIRQALGSRNVQAQSPLDSHGAKLRTTQKRLAELAKNAGSAPLIMLVEAKVVFFDMMEGRFKWIVYTKLTMAHPGALGEAITREFDVPVFLRFDHQRERDALIEASPAIGERAGKLADEFLGEQSGAAPTATSGSPRAIYFVMVDRFANGDRSNDGAVDLKDPAAFHGGDLQGVIDHLDDIQKLGFDTVWLSPVWKTRHDKFYGFGAFHGYWVEDFAHIDRRFGDRRLLRRLSDELHRRHMKLLLDVVLNHVAFDSPLLKAHPDWFHHNGEIKDWNDPGQLQNNDVMGLPDLAQEKPEVYDYLLKTSEMWIDAVKPDGFRLDAVKHVAPAFWSRYSADIHAHAGRDFFLLGEDLDGDPGHLAKTARADGFDAMFDFPLYFAIKDVFCDDKPLGRLAAILSLDRTYATKLVTLVDNHDLPRIATACHGDPKRIGAALGFMLAMRGIPSMNYGTEVGLTGAHEPENRGDMRFPANPPRAELIRDAIARREQHPELADGALRIDAFDASGFALSRVGARETAHIRVGREGVSFQFEPRAGERPGARRVEFHLTGAKSGQAMLVGAGPELGAWKPEAAPKLTGGALAVELPSAAVYEFKFAVRDAAGKTEWESREDRFLFVPPGTGPVRVDATWNGS